MLMIKKPHTTPEDETLILDSVCCEECTEPKGEIESACLQRHCCLSAVFDG